MKDFRKLKVWEKSHELTLQIYQITSAFPKEEVFGLVSQLRRAAASIPSNIAEGCGRDGDLEFARFIQIGFSSACEVEYQLLLARDLGYLSESVYQESVGRLVEVKQMLAGLLKSIRGSKTSRVQTVEN